MITRTKQWKPVMKSFGILLAGMVAWAAEANTLNQINFAELPGERFEVRMDFAEPPVEPSGYTIQQPARIVLDFPEVESSLAQKKYPLSFGSAKSAVVLTSGGRTRLILNLEELKTYSSRVEGNRYVIEVGSSAVGSFVAQKSQTSTVLSKSKSEPAVVSGAPEIVNVDFRRGEKGEGKVIIQLSEPQVSIDVEQVSGGMSINFANVMLPEKLRRNLDVIDFATPVSLIKADYVDGKSVFTIKANGEYDYLAYQADNEYVISVKPLSKQELEEKKAKFSYVGEKLSLNFQNIEVRSVLQLIADFTELNLVASDTVSGNITLRLDNVPWDQALDLVLKTKGLDKRQIGNVLMVAPAAEIAERERQELSTQKQLTELAPLRTEYIRLSYANAKSFIDLFAGKSGKDDASKSILSERGSAIVDERTNSIVLTETDQKISEFKQLVKNIDIPIRQVMIEARIVIANTDYQKELGVEWGALVTKNSKTHRYLGASSRDAFTVDNFDETTGAWTPSITDTTMVDLGVANPTGAIALSFLHDNGLLDLELSALQNNGHAEIVSQPKVITGDKQTAHIQSGTEVPYQEASSAGNTSTSFKEAVLKLEVTPQITPDDQIIMDLELNQDSVGEIDLASGIPTIDTTELKTQVLVANGQTVVLGGIYQTQQVESTEKVPFLGDLPGLGRLFRKDVKTDNKRELLIFITPKILTENLVKN